MIYEICTLTDPGLTRDNNEDAIAVDALTGLCILADGMGGYNAGEIASGDGGVTLIKCRIGPNGWQVIGWAAFEYQAMCSRALELCVLQRQPGYLQRSQLPMCNTAGMGTTLGHRACFSAEPGHAVGPCGRFSRCYLHAQ